MDHCFHSLNKFNDPSVVIRLCNKLSDYFQDRFTYVNKSDANRFFAEAKKKVDYLINNTLSNEIQSDLLSSKTMLIRNMSRFQSTKALQEKHAHQALRCVELATNKNPDSWKAYLQKGLCLWQIAQFEKGDQVYNNILKDIENNLWKSYSINQNSYNSLTLCQFFHNTYQTAPFLECFAKYELLEPNKRYFLYQAQLYAEAVIRLWYSNYPETIVKEHLQKADELMERAVDAGFNNARHIVDLAFIKAANGEKEVGYDILQTLKGLYKDQNWEKIIDFISKAALEDDLIKQGLALGIASSSVWNKLGTFYLQFFNDRELGMNLYTQSLKLNPSNAIVLTNLSRLLLKSEDTINLYEANRLISKAASCASRHFTWWRSIREEIKSKLAGSDRPDHKKSDLDSNMKLRYLSDLSKAFETLKTSLNYQERGFKLEKIVDRLFKISLGNSFGSYRTSLNWDSTPSSQVDGGFNFFDIIYYRVEVKWTSKPCTPDLIYSFTRTLDTVDVKGLFISVNGFTPEAINQAHALRGKYHILLMDGEELEYVLKGSPSFDEAMRLKQLYFAKDSNPYYKIKPMIQT